MPRFGADGILDAAAIADAADFVLSLSGQTGDPAAVERGRTVFAEQCAVCHGETGQGNPELGAPSLADGIWLYGGARADLVRQIRSPTMGVMPAWEGRLGEAALKLAAVYVHSLGGGR
jgi:cytochrome c oxidase cbb3-type subunit 3